MNMEWSIHCPLAHNGSVRIYFVIGSVATCVCYTNLLMECTDTLYAVKDCLFIEVSFFPVNLLKRSAIIHLYMNITLTIEEPYTEAEYDGHVQLDAETKGSCEESNEQATGYHHRFTSLLVRQCTPDVAEGWGMEEGDTVKYDML